MATRPPEARSGWRYIDADAVRYLTTDEHRALMAWCQQLELPADEIVRVAVDDEGTATFGFVMDNDVPTRAPVVVHHSNPPDIGWLQDRVPTRGISPTV